MRKAIVSSVILLLLVFLSINTSAFEKNEAEKLIRNASVVSLYSGPWFTLSQLLKDGQLCDDIPSLESQKEKYSNAVQQIVSESGAVGECTYLSTDEYLSILNEYFSPDLAKEFYEKSMQYTARSKDNGPKLREVDGLLYDFGNYGDPCGAYFIDSEFKLINYNKASLFLKYRSDSPPREELEDVYDFEIFEYEFILKKDSNGKWKFTKFISIYDNINKSIYPDIEIILNPKTNDIHIIAICALAVSAAAAVVFIKKKKAV